MKKLPGFIKCHSGIYRCFLTVVILLLTVATASYSQNVSGLEGKSLTKIDDIASGLISLIGSGGLEGKIISVKVTADGERTLKIVVDYTGFPTAYLHAKVLAPDKTFQDEVKEAEMDLTGKASPLDLHLNLKENVAEGFNLESAFLQLRVSKSKTAVGGLLFLYALNKNWQKDIKAENLVLHATLQPVGITSQLKETDKVLVVPVFRPVMMQQVKYTGATVMTTSKTAEMSRTTIPAAKTRTATVPAKTGTLPAKTAAQPVKTATLYDKTTRIVSKPSVTTQQSTTVTKPAYALSASQIKVKPALVQAGLALNKEETEKGALGPDNNPIPLFEDLTVTKDFEYPFEITNISMDVYPDKNPESGLFYYTPSAYHVKWTPDEGYSFRILYGTGSEERAGNVRMVATLTPNISKREIDLITRLVTSYAGRNMGLKDVKVRLIPIREDPSISFPADLNSQYDVNVDQVSTPVSSSLRDPFQVSWVTDNSTKDEMQVALLERTGIQGMLSLQPQSESIPDIKIPVIITLADTRTIGRIELENKKWRNSPWQNLTPYPLKLKHLHMILVKDEGDKSKPFIYSWAINDLLVPAGASVLFDASNVPSWLDDANMAQRIWVEYSVVDCDECDEKIISKITGGTYGSNVKKLSFETFRLFETLDAQFIQIKVRSKQGDPKGEKVIEFDPLRIYQDNELNETIQLYVPLDSDLSYEYLVTVVMKDGNAYKSEGWINSDEQEVYLGLDVIRNAIPGIPEKDDQ